jgi:hypothetical protein
MAAIFYSTRSNAQAPLRPENCVTALTAGLRPSLQIVDERQALLVATFQAVVGHKPVYIPLDIEQGVDPFDCFERHKRDR